MHISLPERTSLVFACTFSFQPLMERLILQPVMAATDMFIATGQFISFDTTVEIIPNAYCVCVVVASYVMDNSWIGWKQNQLAIFLANLTPPPKWSSRIYHKNGSEIWWDRLPVSHAHASRCRLWWTLLEPWEFVHNRQIRAKRQIVFTEAANDTAAKDELMSCCVIVVQSNNHLSSQKKEDHPRRGHESDR